MILLLDTSTSLCKLTLIENGQRFDAEWQADRQLAHGLLGYIESALQRHGKTFSDITGIAAYSGPGSFTGLRIGSAVMNTLADALQVPIVGAGGENWQSEAVSRLERGDNDQVVVPIYGSEAHITPPRK